MNSNDFPFVNRIPLTTVFEPFENICIRVNDLVTLSVKRSTCSNDLVTRSLERATPLNELVTRSPLQIMLAFFEHFSDC